ncbi:hypothetical protein M407DRAFT_80626, partial [Tulasnella calospora MUT 4182]
YHIEHRGVNADGDYYEILKWREMFGKQNTNTFRYWNNDGSFYESYPDRSDYYSMYASHESTSAPNTGDSSEPNKAAAECSKGLRSLNPGSRNAP